MAFKTEAIILSQRTLRGADRIYEILTPHDGKLSVVARSAGKSSSKMSGHLQPFAHVKLMIGRGYQDHVAGVRTITSYRELRASWFDFILASSLVELIMRFNVPGQAAQQEFELLQQTLDRVVFATTQRDKVLLSRIYLWKLLSMGGWMPNLDQCAQCQKAFEDAEFYYQPLRGFVCAEHNRNGISMTAELLQLLRDVLASDDWHVVVQKANSGTVQKQWFELSQHYYQDVINYPLGSLKLFQHV